MPMSIDQSIPQLTIFCQRRRLWWCVSWPEFS